jgi:hypothetical protein
MLKCSLIIKCWNCGNEETIVKIFGDNVIDFNLDKLCYRCNSGWMIKKDLTLQKCLIPLSQNELPITADGSVKENISAGITVTSDNPKLF